MTTEETKRKKAENLRYKKPIVRNLNLDSITEDLWDIQEECERIRWYTDSEDGEDSLINALDGDEDEAYEFKMAFADLCAECDSMRADLQEEWVPECFDIFFVAIEASAAYGGLFGWDTFEGDYLGINCSDCFAEDEAKKKYSLKAAIDILRDQNTGYLQVVKEIEKLYENMDRDFWSREKYSKESREWERYTDALPQEAWIQ